MVFWMLNVELTFSVETVVGKIATSAIKVGISFSVDTMNVRILYVEMFHTW